ncbi:MAG: protein kinase [Sulfurimonas sp.]|jgi:serine/threonine protein kinase
MKSSNSNKTKSKKKSHSSKENSDNVKSMRIGNSTCLFDENCQEKWLNKFKVLVNNDNIYLLDIKEDNIESCFLGQGGSGFVFKYKLENTKLAIKFSLNRKNRNDEVKKITDIQNLFHPNTSPNYRVTQYIEQGDTTIIINGVEFKLYYIVMDLADGTINDLMCAYQEERNMSKLIGQIKHLTETINVLHKSSFAHRDIKPENILLKGDLPVLADFGMSGCTKVKTIRRKGPKYWPNPEFLQACDEKLQDLDEQSDIFNLGCLFFYIFTGKYPIGLIDIKQELEHIDDELKNILMDMLQYSKDERLKNIGDAINILEKVI